MKKLTKKQRAEIYLKVAEYLELESPDTYYLCGKLSFFGKVPYDDVLSTFEEFILFRPEQTEGGSLWWAEGEFGLSVRITCMLLCYYMIKNPIK